MKIEIVLYMQMVHYRDILLFIKSSQFKGHFQSFCLIVQKYLQCSEVTLGYCGQG